MSSPTSRNDAIKRALEFFEQPNTTDMWTYNDTAREEIAIGLRAALSEKRDTINVPLSLAERSTAMFRSVDPEGSIAREWMEVLNAARR